MGLLIGVFVLVMVAMVLLAALGIVAVLVSALFMGLVALAFAAAAAIAVCLLVTGGAAMTAAGIFAGISAFLMTLGGFYLLTRRGRRRRDREDRIVAARASVPSQPAKALPASRDPELDGAFAKLAAHADGSRARLSVAQEACRLFLVLADQFPADMEAGDLAVRIRKRIPEHVTTCLTMMDSAKPSERHAYVEDAVLALEKVGAEAERHRTRLQSHAAHVLDLQRRHLTRGSGPAPLSLD